MFVVCVATMAYLLVKGMLLSLIYLLYLLMLILSMLNAFNVLINLYIALSIGFRRGNRAEG